jgi:nucleoside-diphosphate-sugar epimerase
MSQTIRPRRCVVTGPGGFLGRRLVARLENAGVEVLGLGRDVGFDVLRDDLPVRGGDHVFHLAAATGVPDSWQDPVQFHLLNAHASVRVLDQCRRHRASLTYVGAYIYGVPQVLPISEDHPLDPSNPYAFSKWMGEQACAWFAHAYDVPISAIRLFNVYGAGQSDRFVVARIVDQVLNPRLKSIQVMDLAPRRDYLYVDDAVDALVSSIPVEGYRVLNVGSGVSHGISDVIEAAFEASGLRKSVEASGEVRPNEIPDVRADCSAIRAAFGWSPRFSLQEGVAAMIRELKA